MFMAPVLVAVAVVKFEAVEVVNVWLVAVLLALELVEVESSGGLVSVSFKAIRTGGR